MFIRGRFPHVPSQQLNRLWRPDEEDGERREPRFGSGSFTVFKKMANRGRGSERKINDNEVGDTHRNNHSAIHIPDARNFMPGLS